MGFLDRLKKKPKSVFDIYGEEVMHEFVHNPDPVVLKMLKAEGKPPLPLGMGDVVCNFLDKFDGTSFETTIKQYVEMKEKLEARKLEEAADTPIGSWHLKGAELSHSGNYEEAIKCFDKALELDPNLANSWYNRGNPFMGLKNYEEAIKCYKMALELSPTYLNAWFNLGDAWTKLGEETLGTLHYSNAEISLMETQRFREAIKCFDKVLELDPNDNDALVCRSDLVTRLAKIKSKRDELNAKIKARLDKKAKKRRI